MALQLGAVREALVEAGASEEKAGKAAEELAGYESRFVGIENRLTRLTTLIQAAIGILIALLISQAALQMQLGQINGQLAQIARAIH